MLADDVDVLEVSLDEMALVDRGGAGGIVDDVHDLDGQANGVSGSEAQGRALVQADRARRRQMRPDLANRFRQEGAPRANISLGVADVRLDQGLIAQEP